MKITSAFFVSLMLLVSVSHAQEVTYDLLIKNGRIVDGTGSPWYSGDLAIKDGKIAAIGKLTSAKAKRDIDASGLVIAPGFIDMMGQTAAPFLKDPNAAYNLLTQGITTINAGEGGSDAPLSDAEAKTAGWQTMRQFLAKLDATGMPMNMVQTVGHTQVRAIVIGDKDRQATPAELDRMRGMVQEAMEAGAIGARAGGRHHRSDVRVDRLGTRASHCQWEITCGDPDSRLVGTFGVRKLVADEFRSPRTGGSATCDNPVAVPFTREQELYVLARRDRGFMQINVLL